MKVPFSPYFLQQLEAGQVKSISSKGDTIHGTFNAKLRYPPNDEKATPTTLFATQVPAFWNSNAADRAPELHKASQVNAQNPNPGTSLLAELLLGFGPTLLLFGLFYFIARRAMRAGGGGSAGSATSGARRRAGSTRRRSG